MSIELVGILNVTPNSTRGDGLMDPRQAVARAEYLFETGASMVDIGAEATNPTAALTPIDDAEQWRRLEPVVSALLPKYPDYSFSIDTSSWWIVEQIVQVAEGKLFYVNDVRTFVSERLIEVTAKNGLGAMISSSPLAAKGDMQRIHYDKSIWFRDVNQVEAELRQQGAKLLAAGVDPAHIIYDPGLGFGKTMADNRKLISFAERVPDLNVMIGTDGKRVIATDAEGNYLSEDLEEIKRLKVDPERNHEAFVEAMQSGAKYIRVGEPSLYRDLLPEAA